MSEKAKEIAAKQYLVLAKVKGDASEILRIVEGCFNILGTTAQTDNIVADRAFDLLLSFSNDISEIIKEYLASNSA